MAETVKKTGDKILIQGNTDLNEGTKIFTRINGEDNPNGNVDNVVQSRAQKIYNDLINAGVDKSQVQIMPPIYNSPNGTSTKITINKPQLPDNIKNEQIINK